MRSGRKRHEQLLLARIGERHIPVIAREDVTLDDLSNAGMAQQTDLLPAPERGGTIGGLVGAAARAAVVSIPSAAATLGGIVSPAITLIRVLFGAGTAGMNGIAVPNTRIPRFHDALKDGARLLIVVVRTHALSETWHYP